MNKAKIREPEETLREKQAEYSAPTDALGEQDSLYDELINRQGFSYDVNADALYDRYKDEYIRAGQLAMRDTAGQAAALTGGYGSSYAQSVGQQQYDGYMQQLGDAIPELYNLALERYRLEGQQLENKLALTGQRAKEQADSGDFSGYEELYGADAAGEMQDGWIASNPVMAYQLGYISGDEYKMICGRYPNGYRRGDSGWRASRGD